MANAQHLQVLRAGVSFWNQWRADTPDVHPDLSQAPLSRMKLAAVNLCGCNLAGAHLNSAELDGADLSRANLSHCSLMRARVCNANLTEANLAGANLGDAKLTESVLSHADLGSVHAVHADLRSAVIESANLSRGNFFEADLQTANLKSSKLLWANLTRVNLRNAVMHRCDLTGVSLIDADASGADLRWANLTYARIIESNICGANLSESRIYGVSAWNIGTDRSVQVDLIISPPDEPKITVDDLEMAQFVYVLLHSPAVRRAILTLTAKVVLLLGRFTPARMRMLQVMRDVLRARGYVPVVFDFAGPATRDLTETVSTLAHLSRFVVADITDARSVPQELMAVVPNLPSVPVQPLLLHQHPEYGLFEHFRRFPWVLPVWVYKDEDDLVAGFGQYVIDSAEQRLAGADQ